MFAYHFVARMTRILIFVAAATTALAIPARTAKDALRSYGIGLDNSSLVAALSDERDKVRGLAAAQLAAEHDDAALPKLREALHLERNTYVKFTLAQSLNSLGDSEGIYVLQSYCLDESAIITLRQLATYDLMDRGNEACWHAMVSYLNSEDDSIRESALLYLRKLPNAPKTPPSDLGSLLLQINKNDSLAYNRELAAEAIGRIGDQATKDALALRLKNKP